jgi:putative transposase
MLMMGFVRIVVVLFKAFFFSRLRLVAENLALRQQLVVLQRTDKRPRLRKRDRILWVWLSRLWRGWQSALLIVQPETVTCWHRQGFRLYWRWKSRNRPGRPKIDADIHQLIRRMPQGNPTWGAPRILSELHLLGYSVAESTVNKYMVRQPKPPSQNWRIFLDKHIGQIAAIDFFTVPTITFRILYCFIVLRHDRRHLVHVNVTANPTAQWTARQVRQASPYDKAPKYMIRDRDSIYGEAFRQSVEQMVIEEVLIARQSPW